MSKQMGNFRMWQVLFRDWQRHNVCGSQCNEKLTAIGSHHLDINKSKGYSGIMPSESTILTFTVHYLVNRINLMIQLLSRQI